MINTFMSHEITLSRVIRCLLCMLVVKFILRFTNTIELCEDISEVKAAFNTDISNKRKYLFPKNAHLLEKGNTFKSQKKLPSCF